MKKGMFFCLMLGALISTQGCIIDDNGIGCLRGNQNVVLEEIFLADFDEISVTGSADVFITQGDDFSVEVETDENLIDRINTDVRNDTWNIEFDRCVNRVTRFDVFITMPEVKSLNISGSGKIIGENDFLGTDLELRISGSGELDIYFEGEKVETRISGSGNIVLGGIVDDVDHTISGSGDISSFGLAAVNGDVNVRGSGDVELSVSNNLKALISGSGDIFYKGDAVVDATVSGSGSIVKVE